MLLLWTPKLHRGGTKVAVLVPDPAEEEFEEMKLQVPQGKAYQPRVIPTLVPGEAISFWQTYGMSLDARVVYAFGVSIPELKKTGGPSVQLRDILEKDCSQTRYTIQ